MKKLLLIPFLMISWLCADMWETSWHQGNALYHISNKKGDRLELACNYDGGSFSLVDSKSDLTEVINVIINDETKIISPSRVSSTEGTSTANMSWAKLIYELQTTTKFVIESGKDSYTFEPTNFKKVLSDITESCLEYQNGAKEDTNSMPDKEIQAPDKPPVMVDNRGFLLSASMAIPITVLMSETLSAPAASAAFAISAMSVTLGVSFTISVL